MVQTRKMGCSGFFGFSIYLSNGCRVESDVDGGRWIVCGVGWGQEKGKGEGKGKG